MGEGGDRLMISIRTESHGPVFDGRASVAARDFAEALSEDVAEDGRRKVQQNLKGSLRHPTGYYQSHVRVEARSSLVHVVTDNGVVYGPWLEGTGSRNQTTRFKGYASFRRAVQATEAGVDSKATEDFRKYKSRME